MDISSPLTNRLYTTAYFQIGYGLWNFLSKWHSCEWEGISPHLTFIQGMLYVSFKILMLVHCHLHRLWFYFECCHDSGKQYGLFHNLQWQLSQDL